MSGLGGLNKSAHGVVPGLVQLQLPAVQTPEHLAWQTRRPSCGFAAPVRDYAPQLEAQRRYA